MLAARHTLTGHTRGAGWMPSFVGTRAPRYGDQLLSFNFVRNSFVRITFTGGKPILLRILKWRSSVTKKSVFFGFVECAIGEPVVHGVVCPAVFLPKSVHFIRCFVGKISRYQTLYCRQIFVADLHAVQLEQLYLNIGEWCIGY